MCHVVWPAASVREHHGRQREYRNRERELDAALHDKRLLLQDLNHHAKRLGADVASFGDCLAALQEAEHEREMQRQNVEKQECDRATVREREYERKRQEQQELEEELRLLQTKLAAVRQEIVHAEQEAVSAARERERRESAAYRIIRPAKNLGVGLLFFLTRTWFLKDRFLFD